MALKMGPTTSLGTCRVQAGAQSRAARESFLPWTGSHELNYENRKAVLSDQLCANFVTLMQKLNQVGRSLTGMQALYIPKFCIILLRKVHILSSFLL